MTITPVISEKAMAQIETGVYSFMVPTDANKIEIARAVSSRYKVKVASVNVTVHKGKTVRTPVQRGRRYIAGQRAKAKKAFVTLEKGEKITLFEEAK